MVVLQHTALYNTVPRIASNHDVLCSAEGGSAGGAGGYASGGYEGYSSSTGGGGAAAAAEGGYSSSYESYKPSKYTL